MNLKKKNYHLGEERQNHGKLYMYLAQEHSTVFQGRTQTSTLESCLFRDLLREVKFFGTSFKRQLFSELYGNCN